MAGHSPFTIGKFGNYIGNIYSIGMGYFSTLSAEPQKNWLGCFPYHGGKNIAIRKFRIGVSGIGMGREEMMS